MKKYDYLIVGCGLYGVTSARLLTNKGYKCLIVDKRDHIGGNVYDENIDDILVHTYGPHVFHTNNEDVWEFINRYSEWNPFSLQVMAKSGDEMFNLPFNMNTFYKAFGTKNPQDAKRIIQDEIDKYGVADPKNLEEQAISLVGKTIYEKLIKGYTEKQWGKPCTALEPFIIKRLPIRYTYDNAYFNDKYCAIPSAGYSAFVSNMLIGTENETSIEYLLNTEFNSIISNTEYEFNNIIYTGAIDELFNYELGELQWRSLRFAIDELEMPNYQGCAQMNYIDSNIAWTRIIEHKHFYPRQESNQDYTIVTYEYPDNWKRGKEMYYPVNNKETDELYSKYIEHAKTVYPNMRFGGRLGKYKYYNMDQIILDAITDMKSK